MLCLRVYLGRKKQTQKQKQNKSKIITTWSFDMKTTLKICWQIQREWFSEEKVDSCLAITADRGNPGHSFFLEMLVFTVESKAGFSLVPGESRREGGGSREPSPSASCCGWVSEWVSRYLRCWARRLLRSLRTFRNDRGLGTPYESGGPCECVGNGARKGRWQGI